MTEHLFLGLAVIIVLGIAAQWFAWRVKLPSILILLLCGFLAGPVTGLVNPDAVFGDLLFPVVSISVAIILFEGALSLSFAEYKETGGAVHSLITVGALITWVLTSIGAVFILGLDLRLSVLIGSILVVSGPTVVIPLLRHVRPKGSVSKILAWEGILVDPLGALLAVLVFEVVRGGDMEWGSTRAAFAFLRTLALGGGIGVAGGLIIVQFLKRFWIPDFLKNPVTLMMIIITYSLSDLFQQDSGLLSVTVMGITLANQKSVAVRSIAEFVEDLRVLLISALFILLAARLDLVEFEHINIYSLLFLAFLIVVVRPISVFVSTIASSISWREKVFVALVYPRGIVAAAVASVFAIRMSGTGFDDANQLVPVTFLVIVGTVTFYGLGSPLIARLLGVSRANPQGVLIVGANPWAITVANALKDEGFPVLLADINRYNVYTARLAGIRTYHGSIISNRVVYRLDLEGIGRILALTPNDGLNALATLHFAEIFGSSEVYQLTLKEGKTLPGEDVSKDLHGRFIFAPGSTYSHITSRFNSGAVVKKTTFTEEFDFDSFKALYGEQAIPIFLITESGELIIATLDRELTPKAGQTLISIVDPVSPDSSVPIGLVSPGKEDDDEDEEKEKEKEKEKGFKPWP